MATRFQLGIDHLLTRRRAWLRGRRVGLLAHPASVDANGVHASVRLRDASGRRLVALFGPEHGFYGRGGAGETMDDERHPAWGIPIHSLYGAHRRPTAEMLKDLDVLIVDLQDIAVRCYTFVTTLRYAMEACAEQGKTVIVCDRPVPLPNTVDGPLPEPGFESFVAGVPVPLVYGMTPAETASYLMRALNLDVDLRVCELRGYRRTPRRGEWGPWISPSPGIRYWETAWTYPIAVFTEALTSLDCGRGGTEPFQVLAAPWIDAGQLVRELGRRPLSGLRVAPYGGRVPGVRLHASNPDALQPVVAVVHILAALQKLYGAACVWDAPGTRLDWFDKLMGTDAVGLGLRGGLAPREIVRGAAEGRSAFDKLRRDVLLYRR